MGTAPIEGDGVVIRSLWAGDRDRWFELAHDPDELAFGVPGFVDPPHDPVDVARHIAVGRERWAERKPGPLAIAARDQPARFVGIMSWRFDVPAPFRIADIGYAVHPDARGRGVAQAAIRAFTDWLMDAEVGPGMARVQLDHSVENAASCRAALGAGFEREGVRRSYLPLRDPDGTVRRHDVCLHGIVS